MFGRKPPAGPGETAPPADRVAPTPFQPAAQRLTPAIPSRPAEPEAGLPSRPMSVASALAPPAIQPPAPRRPAEPVRQESAKDVRKLIVGREITLSGEIAACDHLIVEGTVEASVKDCHRLEVAEAGLFRGTVEINEAEIAGRFEGQINVQGRLVVRSTGRIEGKIQYGELAVEAGGTVDGEIHGQGKGPAKAAKPVPAPPPPEAAAVLNLTPAPADEAKG